MVLFKFLHRYLPTQYRGASFLTGIQATRGSAGPNTRSPAPMRPVQAFGFVDLTMTDFITAFLLASQLQRSRRRRTIRAILRPDPAIRDRASLEQLQVQPSSPMGRSSMGEGVASDCLSEVSWREASMGSRHLSIGDDENLGGPPPSPRRQTLDGRTTELEGDPRTPTPYTLSGLSQVPEFPQRCRGVSQVISM